MYIHIYTFKYTYTHVFAYECRNCTVVGHQRVDCHNCSSGRPDQALLRLLSTSILVY